MSPETVERELVPLAAELIGTLRDYSTDDVAAVLRRVPEGRLDALAVVLAAMVDPDAKPSDLLAWTAEMPQSRVWESPIHRTDAALSACPDCGVLVRRGHLSRHRQRHHEKAVEVAS